MEAPRYGGTCPPRSSTPRSKHSFSPVPGTHSPPDCANPWRRCPPQPPWQAVYSHIVDSQSVKTTDRGGAKGFDGGKLVKGRKRHLLVDTHGHLLGVQVTAANLGDREGMRRIAKELPQELLTLLKKLGVMLAMPDKTFTKRSKPNLGLTWKLSTVPQRASMSFQEDGLRTAAPQG